MARTDRVVAWAGLTGVSLLVAALAGCGKPIKGDPGDAGAPPHVSTIVRIGNAGNGFPPKLGEDLAITYTYPDGQSFDVLAMPDQSKPTSVLALACSDPQIEADAATVVASGKKPIVRSVRIVAAATGTTLCFEVNDKNDVVHCTGGSAGDVVVVQRHRNGTPYGDPVSVAVGQSLEVPKSSTGPLPKPKRITDDPAQLLRVKQALYRAARNGMQLKDSAIALPEDFPTEK